jgi:hypothetical protein
VIKPNSSQEAYMQAVDISCAVAGMDVIRIGFDMPDS